jgi:hypothetical protein
MLKWGGGNWEGPATKDETLDFPSLPVVKPFPIPRALESQGIVTLFDLRLQE